jgi:hypothetical protein
MSKSKGKDTGWAYGIFMELRYTHRVFMVTPEGQRLLEGPRCSQEGNIKMAVQQIGSEGVEWINLAQYSEKCPAAVNTVVN